MSVTLIPHAMLYGPAAARLHDFDGFTDHGRLAIILPRGAHVPADVPCDVHQSRVLSIRDRHVIDAIAVTIVPVTLVHLAAEGLNAAKALDGCLRKGMSPLWLRQEFARWESMGNRSATLLLRSLAQRLDGRLPRSWFQRIAHDLFAGHRIELVEEHPVHDDSGNLLAELDLAHVQLKVGVECQSWRWHGSPDAQRRDAQRRRTLRKLGWEIVDVWWTDLHRIDEVLEELLIVLERQATRRARK